MIRCRFFPVTTLAATTTVSYGVLFYAYGVLLVPMEHDLGWSRAFLSGAFSASLVVAAILTVPIGRWLDTHQPRPLLLTGSVGGAVLVGLWSQAAEPIMFVTVWLLLGGCQAVLFYEPAFTILTKWFEGLARHRAITSVTLVAGLASTIFGPLSGALETALGWRGAVAVLGLILATVTIPGFLILSPRPTAELREEPRGLREVGAGGMYVTPRVAFAGRSFRRLSLAYLLSAVTTFATAVHLVPYLVGRGVGAQAAATVLGGIGLMQVLGRAGFLRLSARHGSLRIGTWVLTAKAVGLLVLLMTPGLAGMSLFVLVYGSANGIATLTRATTLAELYGPTHYGAISSLVASIAASGGAVAPFLAGAAIDVFGDGSVLAGLAVLSLIAAAANASASPSPITSARRPGRSIQSRRSVCREASVHPGHQGNAGSRSLDSRSRHRNEE